MPALHVAVPANMQLHALQIAVHYLDVCMVRQTLCIGRAQCHIDLLGDDWHELTDDD